MCLVDLQSSIISTSFLMELNLANCRLLNGWMTQIGVAGNFHPAVPEKVAPTDKSKLTSYQTVPSCFSRIYTLLVSQVDFELFAFHSKSPSTAWISQLGCVLIFLSSDDILRATARLRAGSSGTSGSFGQSREPPCCAIKGNRRDCASADRKVDSGCRQARAEAICTFRRRRVCT